MGSRYRLHGKLEGGALAELYRAQRDAQTSVVVKLFHPETSDSLYAQQIAETQRRLVAVAHPGICHVLDLGLVDHRLAIVREDPGRCTLGQVLQRLNSKDVVLQSPLALAFIIELLECVQQAHEAGVVHGALTPGNVLMTPAGRPAVCDFGALIALSASPALKKSFGPRGRSSYRAPELSKADVATVQSDLYSLGAMSYELLTLREPTMGALAVRHQDLPPPSRIDRRLSSRLDPLILRALEQAPGRRYKAASEMAAALRDFLVGNGGMPARAEFERFVEQLFPPGMALELGGALPLPEPFTLDEVSGAQLEGAEERSLVVADRPGFSVGFEAAEELPARQDERDTQPRSPPSATAGMTWDAPESSAPVARKVEGASPDLRKRMRVIEDFDPSGDSTQPSGERLMTLPELPKVFPGQPVATQSLDTLPAQIELVNGEPLDTDQQQVIDQGRLRRLHTEEKDILRLLRSKRRLVPVVIGASVLAGAIFVLTLWRLEQGKVVIPYVPPPPALTPFNELRPVRPQVEQRKIEPRPPPTNGERPSARPPAPFDDCYLASKRTPGFLAVSTNRTVTVFIDGLRVCGALSKVAVSPGKRKISVVDSRTKEHYDTALQIEAGKTFRVTPTFKSR